MVCVSKGPHKDRKTGMSVCLWVCVRERDLSFSSKHLYCSDLIDCVDFDIYQWAGQDRKWDNIQRAQPWICQTRRIQSIVWAHRQKEGKNQQPPPPKKQTNKKIQQCLFTGSAHEESSVISYSCCITLYIALLVISKWSFGDLKIRILALKFINNEIIQLMVTLA